MAYRFKLDEGPGNALQRIAGEQFERALAHLRQRDTTAGIHGTRKCIKRLRALLRLARPGLPKERYVSLNAILRDAGRTLSASRDRDVMLTTLTGLAADFPSMRQRMGRLRASFDKEAESSATVSRARLLRKAREQLTDAAGQWRSLADLEISTAHLTEGLARGLADIAAANEAAATDLDEAFHDLRKAVQRHWRHMRLIEAGWPAYFGARAEEARAVSDLLGRAQDLTLLIGHIASGKSPDKPDKQTGGSILALAYDQRTALRAAARAHVERLLAEGPRAHARRAETYWQAARAIDESAAALATPASGPSRKAQAARKRPARR